jgi:hypothetical protein
MLTLRQQILEALSPLLGLPLTDISRAADMRMFGFGALVTQEVRGQMRTVAPYALHVQCPWRIEGPAGIVTGRSDLSEAADPETEIDWDNWDYVNPPSLQDKLLGEFFNEQLASLIVNTIAADDCGGVVFEFAQGLKLRLFPAGTMSEDWRVFRPGDDAPHFVISGGKLEAQEE